MGSVSAAASVKSFTTVKNQRPRIKRGGEGKLRSSSVIVPPVIDDELRQELATKDIRDDADLRHNFLERMNQAYIATLDGHADNVSDYKFFTDKVVGSIPELQRYDEPYVCCGMLLFI